MKTKILIIIAALCASGLLVPSLAQNVTNSPSENNPPISTPPGEVPQVWVPRDSTTSAPDQSTPDQGAMNAPEAAPAQPEAAPSEKPPVTSTVILPTKSAPEAVPPAFAPPAQAIGGGTNDLNLNFNRAPLEMVLSYLSDAAGFIIVQETRASGTVTVVGKHLTLDEAVNLLNTELNKNGYAAIREGRTLTIVEKNDAKNRNIPVKTGNSPNSIPNNAEIATWIIPIRFVEARQLVSDLSSFVSAQATIVANEAGNSIVVTDTQSNIRHLAEIIQAVDNSAEAETEIRVFRLKFANPNDVATELASVFPSSTSGSMSQAPIRFGGGGPFGAGGGPGAFFRAMASANTANNSSQQRIQKATQVTAVADARIQAVIVSAPKDLMDQIAGMMTDLDVPSDRDQGVSVVQLQNADPQQVAQVLQNMFQSTTATRAGTTSSQNSQLMQRAQNATTSMSSGTTTGGVGGTGVGSSPGYGGRQF